MYQELHTYIQVINTRLFSDVSLSGPVRNDRCDSLKWGVNHHLQRVHNNQVYNNVDPNETIQTIRCVRVTQTGQTGQTVISISVISIVKYAYMESINNTDLS